MIPDQNESRAPLCQRCHRVWLCELRRLIDEDSVEREGCKEGVACRRARHDNNLDFLKCLALDFAQELVVCLRMVGGEVLHLFALLLEGGEFSGLFYPRAHGALTRQILRFHLGGCEVPQDADTGSCQGPADVSRCRVRPSTDQNLAPSRRLLAQVPHDCHCRLRLARTRWAL